MGICLAVRFDFGTVADFLFDPIILRALRETLVIAVLAMVLGIALGLVLGVMRVSRNPVAAIFAAHESARNQAILRALGATPRQTVIAFAVAQLSACLLACALGIPLGLALFNSVAGDLGSAQLSARTYAAVAAVALLLYAVAVAAPARLLAKRPVTPLLAYE